MSLYKTQILSCINYFAHNYYYNSVLTKYEKPIFTMNTFGIYYKLAKQNEIHNKKQCI